jgi:hypothetical protein
MSLNRYAREFTKMEFSIVLRDQDSK